MIAVLLWTAIGTAVSSGLWALGRGMFDVEPLRRTNYRGAPVLTGVGVLVPVTVLSIGAVARVWDLLGPVPSPWGALVLPAVVAAVGYSLLGVFDDVAGQGQSGGFRGHVGELARGRLTSGMVKLAGGAALGVLVASWLPVAIPVGGTGWLELGLVDIGAYELLTVVRDGAVIALAANLANLFDRAPGRTIKVATVAFAVAAVVSRSSLLAAPGAGIGAGLGLLRADLGERAMLGDAGSNALGALCGMAALVATPSGAGRWLLLGALVGANALSEVVSFTRVIDAVGPLRWFDRLGSVRPR